MTLDGELLQRYANHHDEAAFAELVRRHLNGVFSTALRRVGGDTHLAEDVAQQVFVQLARQAARVAHHPVLTGWLYITTRNQAVMAVRAEKRRKVREAEAHLMNERVSDSASELDWSCVAPVLDWAIEQLPEADRTAILLRFVAQKPFEEIGATLKVSADAARMRVDRATEKLRIALSRRGIVSTAAVISAELTQHAAMAAPAALSTSVTAAALATAPATFGAFATALQIMTTSKLAVGLASGLVILLGLGTARYEINARQQAEIALTKKVQEYESTLVKRDEIRQRIDQTNTVTVALEKSIADEQAAFAAAAAAEAERKRIAAATDPRAVGRAFMLRHPEVKAAFLDYLTAQENSNYEGLFKSLRLTPTQIEEFRFLVREYSMFGRNLDFESKGYAQFSVSTDLPKEEVQRRLRALLGEEGFRQYRDIGQQQPIRNAAAQAAAGLIFTGAPMTQEQARQFIATLTKNRTLDGTGTHFDWDAVNKDAEHIFFPSQISIIGNLRAQDEYHQALTTKSLTKSALLSSSTAVSK